MRTNSIVLTASLCFHPHVAKSWVIYSPMKKKAATKAYEDGYGAVWRGRTSFPLDQYTLRWGLPQSAYSNEALGGGITFALHKNFCDRVLPLFPQSADHLQWSTVLENTFLTCVDLRDTVKRAMDTWAINHRRIYFATSQTSAWRWNPMKHALLPSCSLFLPTPTAMQSSPWGMRSPM